MRALVAPPPELLRGTSIHRMVGSPVTKARDRLSHGRLVPEEEVIGAAQDVLRLRLGDARQLPRQLARLQY